MQAVVQNAIALPVLDAMNFQEEGVRALFIAVGVGAHLRILIQNFSQQQFLSRNFAFLFDGNTFRRLNEPAFSLANDLVAIVDAVGDVRFKSFQMLRRVFDLGYFYREATNDELTAFCGHASLAVTDAAAFVEDADQTIRKFVHAVGSAGVLVNNQVTDIATQASAIGFPISIANGRIEVPQDRKSKKALLSFLLDKIYRGSINQQLYITNSNRPLN